MFIFQRFIIHAKQCMLYINAHFLARNVFEDIIFSPLFTGTKKKKSLFINMQIHTYMYMNMEKITNKSSSTS